MFSSAYLPAMSFWAAFTKLADTYVLLPVALLCAAWLALARAWRFALLWLVLLGFGLCLVAATKVAFVGWGLGIRAWNFTGFSGHAMRASAIAPVTCYLLAQRGPETARRLAMLLSVVFAILIGVSRLEVHVHSVSEVVSGACLGFIVSTLFLSALRRAPCLNIPRYIFLTVMLPLLMFKESAPAPTEQWVQRVALALSGNRAPYTREQLAYAPLADSDDGAHVADPPAPGH
jgi:membrane-associated phospholipid phosphatase